MRSLGFIILSLGFHGVLLGIFLQTFPLVPSVQSSASFRGEVLFRVRGASESSKSSETSKPLEAQESSELRNVPGSSGAPEASLSSQSAVVQRPPIAQASQTFEASQNPQAAQAAQDSQKPESSPPPPAQSPSSKPSSEPEVPKKPAPPVKTAEPKERMEAEAESEPQPELEKKPGDVSPMPPSVSQNSGVSLAPRKEKAPHLVPPSESSSGSLLEPFPEASSASSSGSPSTHSRSLAEQEEPASSAPEEKISWNATPLRAPEPEYPKVARKLRREGKVLLEISVAPSGKVEAVKILEPCPWKELNQAAQQGITRWEFAPPGKAVILQVPVVFSLE